MGHTYTNLNYHGVFSTKQRRPWLDVEIMGRLREVVGGIIRRCDGKLLAMNGPDDHVHLLAMLSTKRPLSDQIRDIKAGSSKWIHRNFPSLGEFAWQEGYSAFSVSKSIVPRLVSYINDQCQHHKKASFSHELKMLSEKHEIEYDPNYAFD